MFEFRSVIMLLRKWIICLLLLSMAAGCNNPWSSGDRVIVSKCSYNALTQPSRFDVVVFKFPKTPVSRNVPTNYIKRLLGLPGEILAIFFGRLYVWTPAENEAPLFKDDNVDPNDLWREVHRHVDDPKARDRFEKGEFRIVRKPPSVMLSTRRIVFDNDFQPQDLKAFPRYERWHPDDKSGWKIENSTGLAHLGTNAGESIDWLRYRHVTRPESGPPVGSGPAEPKLIADSMSYNLVKVVAIDRNNGKRIGEPQFSSGNPPVPHWVGDLMLECDVEVTQAKGEFWMELSKGPYRYRSRFDLTSGQCTLYRHENISGKIEEWATQATSVKGLGKYSLRFANIDARLTVWVNRSLPFGDGKEYHPPELPLKGETFADAEKRRGPTENDLQPASLGSSKGAVVKVQHVRLWRDTYYTASVHSSDYTAQIEPEAWRRPDRFDAFRKVAYSTMYVQPGHYLCLGDNSQASSDSRDWGVVPERLMLGRALAVYFPVDRMGPIR